MEKHRCKICNRRFANGKAMGGHMRSHLAKLPIPLKPHQQLGRNSGESTPPPPPQSSSSLEAKSQKTGSEKPRMQSFRSVNREFFLSDSAVHDRESDTESPKKPTRRRSKRHRKSVVTVLEWPPEQEPVSSVISETTFSEEDVAMCLLMLSRDKWTKKKVEVKKEADEYVGEDEDESFSVTRTRVRNQAKYRCETCKKVFRSYQALGGHRASHKKIKDDNERGNGSGCGGGENYVIEQRIFECPFCFKVFESGQALGGHKKVHLSNVANARNSAKFGDNMIDLNLPAPEDDDEVSQVEFSAVSNAFHPNNY